MPRSAVRFTGSIRSIVGLALTVACLVAAVPARAVGQRVDVAIVDRDTGEQIAPIYHAGEWWIAGRPGARYAVSIANRSGTRTLNVISVDGVNALSGETAGWSQSGYVLDPYESTLINGWRKNLGQVAAFEFTALPDSYAARTGRPANVGVIGIAVFDERPQPVASVRPLDAPLDSSRAKSEALPATPAPPPSPPSAQDSANRSSAEAGASDLARGSGAVAKPIDKLGTGHGAIERSVVRWTQFDRAQPTPNEIVTIHYDRRENLVAMGVVPQRPPSIAADPFPRSGGFVPDPPRR